MGELSREARIAIISSVTSASVDVIENSFMRLDKISGTLNKISARLLLESEFAISKEDSGVVVECYCY